MIAQFLTILMKFKLTAQPEIAYLKDNKGNIIRKYFAPKGNFFVPSSWGFEIFPKNFFLETIKVEELKNILNKKS